MVEAAARALAERDGRDVAESEDVEAARAALTAALRLDDPEGRVLSSRLHYALALLSALEYTDVPRHQDVCPVCGWPKGRRTKHEPGCSLEAVLLDRTPERLVDLEQRYGDAALGADLNDRKRFRTPIVPAAAPVPPSASDPEVVERRLRRLLKVRGVRLHDSVIEQIAKLLNTTDDEEQT